MNEELKQIARRVNWFEPPEKVVRDVDRFLVYFMQYCLDTDILVMRRYFTDQQFRHALNNRPPGILDDRSAAYWDLVLPEDIGGVRNVDELTSTSRRIDLG